MFIANVKITPRKTLLDPQGKVIKHSLNSLGFEEVKDVRAGKLLTLHVEADTFEKALNIVETSCKKLLANPVTEDYEYEIKPLES